MPLLRAAVESASAADGRSRPAGVAMFPRCGNAGCATGWMRLWRSHRMPIFEGRWTCSAECTGELMRAAVDRETDQGISGVQPHRVPVGLLLLDQGLISPDQLRHALGQQLHGEQTTGQRIPLGRWLVESGVVREDELARILSTQWNCPVFSARGCRPEQVASTLPRLLAETTGTVPLRAVRDRCLYVASPGRVDRSLVYGLERISSMRVVAGLVRDSEFPAAQARYVAAETPPTRILEVANIVVLARTLAKLIEVEKPVESRLVRIHETWWLRMWRRGRRSGVSAAADVEDTLAHVGTDFSC